MTTGLLLVAHGSASGGSQDVVRSLATQVGIFAPHVEVVPAFLDHDEVTPSVGLRLLAAEGATAAVVVPVLLSGAFHVYEDLPAQLGPVMPTRIAAHLGPDERVVAAVASKLPPDAESVVLCATGSSDSRVLDEVSIAARRLEARIGRPVRAAYLSSAEPTLEQAASELLAPVVAPYLLAEGIFSAQLAKRAEALGLRHSTVIGPHAELVALIAERFRSLLT